MSKWDDVYIGVNTIKIPTFHFTLDVGEEFPILTTKQLFIRQAVLEMLWIYQAQSNEVAWLQERNVHIWDKWMIDTNGDWRDENTGAVLNHGGHDRHGVRLHRAQVQAHRQADRLA